MNKALTVLAHRRPHYLQETLFALPRCHGIEDWRVVLVMDRPDEATSLQVHSAATAWGWEHVQLALGNGHEPAYSRISRATLYALALGFATADYVVHLEEDCVPSRDFLTWHATQAERYQDDARVFTVNAYSRYVDLPDTGFGLAPWFTPWGWGTWRDRFEEIRASWDFDFWDRHLNEQLRGHRLGVFPAQSLVRNIGRIGTQPETEWIAREQLAS